MDLLEAIRPEVDAWALDLLQTCTLRAGDFHETQQGNCRILARDDRGYGRMQMPLKRGWFLPT